MWGVPRDVQRVPWGVPRLEGWGCVSEGLEEAAQQVQLEQGLEEEGGSGGWWGDGRWEGECRGEGGGEGRKGKGEGEAEQEQAGVEGQSQAVEVPEPGVGNRPALLMNPKKKEVGITRSITVHND